MKNLLMSPEVERDMQVLRNSTLKLRTQFNNKSRDLPLWKVWLQQADNQASSQTLKITFCTAEAGEIHECNGPSRSEYDVAGFNLPSEPGQRLCTVRLELIGLSITVDSPDQPQILRTQAIVSILLRNPEVEVSTSLPIRFNLWTGVIEFV